MVDEIHGAGGGSDEPDQRTPVEAPNSLRSAATARLLDLLGEGPIVGLADGLQSVYLDDTPLMNSDGTYNFQGVTVSTRTGEPDQSRIPGFPSIESEVDVGVQVKRGMPLVRTVSNIEVDAVRIKARVSALVDQDPDTGDSDPTSVSLNVEIRPQGGDWALAKTIKISGKTTSAYDRQVRVDLPEGGPWDIRVTRLTADSTRQGLRNDTYWTGFTEIIDARLTYPDSALVGLEVDARQFGSAVPKRAYDVKGRIIRVPSNYDPDARTYAGLWDGSYKLAWTDNPAWIYLDLATHPRYGAGLENVDKWALYQIAQYCDELVPNGYGDMEPRFTVNTVIAEAVEAISALNQLASAFRGMTYWGSNMAMPVADMPSDPVKLVNPANVIDGEFEYSGTALRARRSVAMVTWNDPQDNYKKQVEVVEDADAIRQFGWRQVDVTAFGCTSRGQAHRLGKWILYSERAETETVTYTASVDHADLRPGDVIALSDPATAGARLGGRIKATGLSVLELDAVPVEVTGADWYLDVMLPSGVIERRQVASFAGNVVTLVEPLSAEPVPAAVWVLSSLLVEPRLFRVVSVSEAEGARYQVTAAEHDPDKYARVELNLNLPERDTSLFPTGPLKSLVSLSVSEYLYRAGPVVKSGATVSVEAPSDPRVSLYEYQVMRPGEEEFGPLGIVPGVTIDMPDTIPGQYRLRARAMSTTGLRSPWVTLTTSLQGLLAPPSDVTELYISSQAGQTVLQWPPVTDLDLSHYQIRYSPALSGVSWASAQVIVERVSATSSSVALPARRGTYLIKAVDTSGGASLNATLATSSIVDLIPYNAVEVVDEGPAWTGERVNTTEAVGQLQLGSRDPISGWGSLADVVNLAYGVTGLASEGWYYADEIVDLGHVYTSRLTSELLAGGYDILSAIASWATLAVVDRMDETEISQWALALEVSHSSTPQPTAPTDWSEWAPLTIGEYTARAYRFRLHLRSSSPAITPSVSRMRITVDMPDRVADGRDLVCPAGGQRITFEPAFMARPSLAVDAQGLATGDRKQITNIDDAGFDLQFLDAAGNGVARSFDYLAKGYGRRVA